MRLQRKSLSKISLTDLLRKKRSNLSTFLKETGIVSYDLLKSRCVLIGVLPPTEEEFFKIRGNNPPVISSPTEGIVVLEPDNSSSEDLPQEPDLDTEKSSHRRRKKNQIKSD
jgi:hypothetical protein